MSGDENLESNLSSLGRRFELEFPHTEQVARLALELFDGFRKESELKKSDRRLLQAAAFLHGIGYSVDAPDHVGAGAAILKENPLTEFEPDEWLMVIGVVLLHRRNWRSALALPEFPQLGQGKLKRTRRLAAMLRIADGLDHSHIQDAEITFCNRGNKVDKIGVHCRWYTNNIIWAEGKADLWESEHKRPFRIEGSSDKLKHHYAGIVRKTDRAIPALRRILYSQWCIMRDNVPGMLDSGAPGFLHDYRVALRRFRAAIRMCKPLLEDTSAGIISAGLKELSDRFGEARDLHVARALLGTLEGCDGFDPALLLQMDAEIERANEQVRIILQAPECLELVGLAGRFLRVELPALERSAPGPLFAGLAAEYVESALRAISPKEVIGLQHSSDEELLHSMRKRIRRARYYAEFASPGQGKGMRQNAKQLKIAAGALGDIRDRRLLLRRTDLPGVREMVERQESKSWERLENAINKVAER